VGDAVAARALPMYYVFVLAACVTAAHIVPQVYLLGRGLPKYIYKVTLVGSVSTIAAFAVCAHLWGTTAAALSLVWFQVVYLALAAKAVRITPGAGIARDILRDSWLPVVVSGVASLAGIGAGLAVGSRVADPLAGLTAALLVTAVLAGASYLPLRRSDNAYAADLWSLKRLIVR